MISTIKNTHFAISLLNISQLPLCVLRNDVSTSKEFLTQHPSLPFPSLAETWVVHYNYFCGILNNEKQTNTCAFAVLGLLWLKRDYWF